MTRSTDSADRPVAASFDPESRPGHLVRRGVKHLSMAWSATGMAMTIPQFAILVELDRGVGLDQRTLGDRILIDSSTTADTCRRLMQRQLIVRERDPDDGRRYVVRITPAGREALAAALPLAREVDDVLLQRLSADESQQLVALLRKALGLG